MMKLLIRILNKLRLLPMLSMSTSISLSDSTFNIPVINGLGLPNIVAETDWFHDLLQRMKLSDECMFIDVGANIGQTLLQVKALHPAIHYVAFEPNSNCVFYLNKLISSNAFLNTSIVPAGVGSETSLQVLSKAGATDTGATVLPDSKRGLKEIVSIFRFDEISANLGTDNKKIVMKIDVEEYELEALRGMRTFLAYARPAVIIEILDALRPGDLAVKRKKNNEVLDIFTGLGFRGYRIIKDQTITQVERFEMVTEIDTVLMNRKRFNLHDYLFLPPEIETP